MDKQNLELVTQLRHELHRHPELSNHEVWTKGHLIDFLKAHTRLEIVDRGLWFYAIHRAGADRPNVAFRADFDAIPMQETIDVPYASQTPGVAHKCGHDGHSASLAGLALEIERLGLDKNVFFLFQHAEETGDGAAQCAAFIKENGIEEIFGYHNESGFPLGAVGVIDGTAHCASAGMIIHMEGAPAHASAPEMGKNPALAIAQVITAIPALIAPERSRGMVLCTVIQVDIGEKAFGVSASCGDLLLTIRALYEDEMERLRQDLERLARDQAAAYGLSVSFSYSDVFPETVNHKESSDKVRQICRAKGLTLVEFDEASRGSEDYGHYTKLTKGAIFYVGNGTDHPGLHTHAYDFPDEIIETAVDVFVDLARL